MSIPFLKRRHNISSGLITDTEGIVAIMPQSREPADSTDVDFAKSSEYPKPNPPSPSVVDGGGVGGVGVGAVPPETPTGGARQRNTRRATGTRQTRRVSALAGMGLLLVLGTLVVIPKPVVAVNSDWTSEVVSGLTDNMAQGSLAHNGEKLGLLVKYTGGTTAFALRSAAGVWTVPNNNIASGITGCTLSTLDGTTLWVAACYKQVAGSPTHQHEIVYKSADDGVTWTLSYDLDDGGPVCTGGGGSPTFNIADDQVLLITSTLWVQTFTQNVINGGTCAISTQPLYILRSNDGGATWGTPLVINDNKANPAQSSGTIAGADSTSIRRDGTNVYVYFGSSSGTNTYIVTASIADITASATTFWSVPFTTGTCASGSVYTDSGTVVAPLIVGGGSAQAAVMMGGPGVPFYVTSGTGSDVRLHVTTTAVKNPCTGLTPSAVAGTSCTSGSEFYGILHPAVAANSANTYIAAEKCSAPTASFKIYVKSGVSGAWAASYTDTNEAPTEIAADMTASKSYVVYASSQQARAILLWASTPTATVAGPTQEAVIANNFLQGADVNLYDSAVILRTLTTTNAEKIYALDYSSLQPLGPSPQANGCTFDDTGSSYRRGGVMAYHDPEHGGDYLAYLDCTTSNHQDANHFHINNQALGDPDLSHSICTDYCAFDITDGTDASCGNPQLPARAENLDTVESMPISYSISHTGGLDAVVVGFAFNDRSNGNVGVWDITLTNNDPNDRSCQAQQPFSAPGNTYEITTWRDSTARGGDGSDYVAAVGSAANTKIWKVTTDYHNVLFNQYTAVTMNQVTAVTAGTFSTGYAVSGALKYILVKSASGTTPHINLICIATSGCTGGKGIGQTMWTTDLTTASVLGKDATLSKDSKWAFFNDGAGNLDCVNAVTGVVTGSRAMPTDTGFSPSLIKTDDTGQKVWVFGTAGTSAVAAYYDTLSCTTIVNVPPGTATLNRTDNSTTNPCQLDNEGKCKPTSSSSTTTSGGCAPTCTVTAGSACSEHYDGTVAIGKTYVPFPTWTNCASMAVETIGTILMMMGAAVMLTIKLSNGQSYGNPSILGGLAFVGYAMSTYLWQAPWVVIVGLILLAVCVVLIRGALGRSSGGD